VVKRILLVGILGFVVFKLVSAYLPVEVIPVQYDVLEDTLEGEFLILREEKAVTTETRGNFNPVKTEGERVAKGTVIGYLETLGGTSLEKKSTLPVRAPSAGVLSYLTDGLENICAPEMWTQLDLSKLDQQMLTAFEQTKVSRDRTGYASGENGLVVEAGQSIFKIVDNLAPCYFYLKGTGAYPEKVKKGDKILVRLDSNQGKLYKGTVEDINRETGIYRMLIKITNGEVHAQGRKQTGELIISTYEGIVLPEGVLLYRENQSGVFLFKKGKACWQEVECIARLGGKVALSGLERDDWIIATPDKVRDGQWVRRIND
jgi:putative membrane fusion protein